MNTAVPTIVIVLWLAWLAYWLACARNAKANRWREPLRSGLVHRVPLVFAFWLLLAPRHLPAVVRLRWLPPWPVVDGAGLALVAAGLAFAVWARQHLGSNWSGSVTVKENHTLIRTGPYAYVRHPIYSGILLAFFGTAMTIGEWRGLLAWVIVLAALIFKSRVEERRMSETFPDYQDYCRSTAALLPFIF